MLGPRDDVVLEVLVNQSEHLRVTCDTDRDVAVPFWILLSFISFFVEFTKTASPFAFINTCF